MIPITEAQQFVLDGCEALAASPVPSPEALGLVTAEAIRSEELVPPFDNTAVDGYAVQAGDTTNAPVTLTVIGAIAAGEAPALTLGAGQAVRIMTGAPLPDGCDGVVMVENTVASDDGTTVQVNAAVDVGAAVRKAGEDMRPDQVVFEPGTILRPGHLGVLATLGIETIASHRRPVVGVMSTGDELVDGPQKLMPGQIRDSNRRTLLSLVEQAGCTTIDLGLIRDDEAAVEAALRDGAARCDAVITSGGVSMGDFDFIKMVLRKIADMRWMQIAIKPAKPMAFGRLDNTPIFGLPGNPVSSMVSFELLARPGLRKMMGVPLDQVHRPRIQAVADQPIDRRPDGKTHFARVSMHWVDGIAHVQSAGGQGSHQLSAMAAADALAVLPDGNGLNAGDHCQIISLHEG